MLAALTLLCVPLFAIADDCQPGFADACFEKVSENFRRTLSLRKTQSISTAVAAELCSSMKDSLHCVSRVTAEECKGRDEIDSWRLAFQSAYSYVCEERGDQRITEILHDTSCWSIENFTECIEKGLNLPDITHILYYSTKKMYCRVLFDKLMGCQEIAKVGSCPEHSDVFRVIQNTLESFKSASDCSVDFQTVSGSTIAAHSPILGAFSVIIVFIFMF